MKKINLLVCLISLISLGACSQSANHSDPLQKPDTLESSGTKSTAVAACDFKVLVFASYTDQTGKMKFSFEEMETWSYQSTHDYAINNNQEIKSASVEILKNGKAIKTINFTLEKVGAMLTQLNDNGKIKDHLVGMGELGSDMVLRFVFNPNTKNTCKNDVEIFVD